MYSPKRNLTRDELTRTCRLLLEGQHDDRVLSAQDKKDLWQQSAAFTDEMLAEDFNTIIFRTAEEVDLKLKLRQLAYFHALHNGAIAGNAVVGATIRLIRMRFALAFELEEVTDDFLPVEMKLKEREVRILN